MSDYSKLKELAEQATPGPWKAQHPNAGQRGSEVASENGLNQVCADLGPTNSLYIAAANPAVVLALIAENEANRYEREVVCANYDQLKAECEGLRKDASLHAQLQRAAEVLPGAWSIEVVVEHHAGWIDVFDDGGNKVMFDGEGHLAEQVSDAIDLALTLSKENANG